MLLLLNNMQTHDSKNTNVIGKAISSTTSMLLTENASTPLFKLDDINKISYDHNKTIDTIRTENSNNIDKKNLPKHKFKITEEIIQPNPPKLSPPSNDLTPIAPKVKEHSQKIEECSKDKKVEDSEYDSPAESKANAPHISNNNLPDDNACSPKDMLRKIILPRMNVKSLEASIESDNEGLLANKEIITKNRRTSKGIKDYDGRYTDQIFNYLLEIERIKQQHTTEVMTNFINGILGILKDMNINKVRLSNRKEDLQE